MQCNQPFYGIGYGGPNCGQFYTYNSSPYYGTYPEIIGEGEVASVLFPDGSIQFYFVPLANKRWPSYTYNPNLYCNPSCRTNTGVWFIKNFSNPIPPAIFQQYCQGANGEPFSKSYSFSDNNMATSPGFLLKFHNDNWTSTTDLHYFYPSLRECTWFPNVRTIESAAVQVEIPIETKRTCEHVVVCNKPCKCTRTYSSCTKSEYCKNLKQECNSSHMSIVQSISRDSIYKNKKPIAFKEKRSSCSSLHGDKKKPRKNKYQITCECNKTIKPSTTDKSVTTYADQSSSCIGEKGCETQTKYCVPTNTVHKINSTHKNNKTEIWIPKTPLSRKAMEIKSSENFKGIYDSDRNSDACICSSDTDE
ncbi:uncharacterized protein LOC116412685 [Galleria mellonella]|uniref:Uncharacterized protein LOC116412685 n=1 Tax=Galleria mellonella TaxID=7137 RepID=A0A6J3BRV5_GALME|nr:uncharacterized protein LOC116412685 [Galleria mellonella]